MSETLSAITTKSHDVASRPALYIGLAGDAPRTRSQRISLSGADRVTLVRGDARSVVRDDTDGVVTTTIALDDPRVSSSHARLTRVETTWVLEDVGSKNGTVFARKPITRRQLVDGDSFVIGHTALVFRTGAAEPADPDASLAMPAGLATLSPSLAARFRDLARAAPSGIPVGITGDTGTGKELVARGVHELSRRKGRFVAVNCGALAEHVLEGELFGHRRGAFTGASTDRDGLVRSADGGTLFLDEIGELPANAQVALLRVLQEGEVLPLGSDHAIKVDVGLVTATHRNLDEDVDAGRFRADLRARLLGMTVELPALRDRLEDLGTIVADLLERLAPARDVTFAADAVAALYAYPWPLNIRELERALAVALAIAQDRIELRHLPGSVVGDEAPTSLDVNDDVALTAALEAAITRHDGNLAAVARELGKDRKQIRRWVKRLGISRHSDTD